METVALDNELVLNVWTILTIVLTSALTGGALSVALLGTIARNILNNEAGIKAVEALGDSVPKDIAERILVVLEQVQPVIELVEEAVDGVPYDEKGVTEDEVFSNVG